MQVCSKIWNLCPHPRGCAHFAEFTTFFTWTCRNWEFRHHRSEVRIGNFNAKAWKNYRAHTAQSLALTKILQKIQENEHTPGKPGSATVISPNRYHHDCVWAQYIILSLILQQNIPRPPLFMLNKFCSKDSTILCCPTFLPCLFCSYCVKSSLEQKCCFYCFFCDFKKLPGLGVWESYSTQYSYVSNLDHVSFWWI